MKYDFPTLFLGVYIYDNKRDNNLNQVMFRLKLHVSSHNRHVFPFGVRNNPTKYRIQGARAIICKVTFELFQHGHVNDNEN